MPDEPITIERLNQMLLRNPFHRWLGLELTALDDDGVEITAKWREEFVSNPERGFVHGGILAALVDTAGDYAVAAKIGRAVPTIDLRVDYHKGATRGDLRARGKLIKRGGTFSTAEAAIFNPGGELLASGRAVYFTGWARA